MTSSSTATKSYHHHDDDTNHHNKDNNITAHKTTVISSSDGPNPNAVTTSHPMPHMMPSKDDPNILIDTDAIDASSTAAPKSQYLTDEKYLTKVSSHLERISFLSYNMFLRPPPTKTNHNNGYGDYKNERLAYFLNPERNRRIVDCHIICLQEVFSFLNSRKSYCIKKARELGFKYYTTIGGSWMSLKPIDSGLVILSKYPIVDTDQHVFSAGTHIDGWTQKGILYARILLPNNVHLLLFNVHLQADYDPNSSAYWDIQKSQLKELVAFMDQKQKKHPNDQVILMGDMNVDSRHNRGDEEHEVENGSDVYRQMMSTLNANQGNLEYHDVLYEQLGRHPVTFGNCDFDPKTGKKSNPREVVLTHPDCVSVRHSIDYIFYGRKKHYTNHLLTLEPDSASVEEFFTAKGTPYTQLSDHYGVSAVFHTVAEDQR